MSKAKITKDKLTLLKANIASWMDEYEACEFDKGYNSGICDALAEIDEFFDVVDLEESVQ